MLYGLFSVSRRSHTFHRLISLIDILSTAFEGRIPLHYPLSPSFLFPRIPWAIMLVVPRAHHPCAVCKRLTFMWCARCQKAWYCSPQHFTEVRPTSFTFHDSSAPPLTLMISGVGLAYAQKQLYPYTEPTERVHDHHTSPSRATDSG